jgi:phosphohistidine phosphatase SixA
MKHLYVARHGQGNRDRSNYALSPVGVLEIEAIARTIRNIDDASYRIICSSDDVCRESAGVLSRILGAEYEIHPLLSGLPSMEDVHRQVKKSGKRANSLILLAHRKICSSYPSYFLSVEFRSKGRISAADNELVHFDIEGKRYDFLKIEVES